MYYSAMPKPSHREKLLSVGMRVVHERGFAGASVRDIVQAAGVPQGSFTNHFASKQAFGLEVIALYVAQEGVRLRATLGDTSRTPLARVRAWIAGAGDLRGHDMRNGCLLGNFSAEVNECGEAIRARLVEAFDTLRGALAQCLREAVAAGELPPAADCEDLAAFTLASLQGALLMAKAARSAEPLERFEKLLFDRVLRPQVAS